MSRERMTHEEGEFSQKFADDLEYTGRVERALPPEMSSDKAISRVRGFVTRRMRDQEFPIRTWTRGGDDGATYLGAERKNPTPELEPDSTAKIVHTSGSGPSEKLVLEYGGEIWVARRAI